MPPPRNRRFAAEQRRHQVAELYLQGSSQTTISEKLGISQTTVCRDLKRCEKEWQAAASQDIDKLRNRELQRIDLVEREAWAGWLRSQKPAQSAVVSENSGNQNSRKTMKNQVGDPRFLDQINKCITQRRAILGFDMPEPVVALEDPLNAHLSFEERRQQFLSRLTLLGFLAGPGSDGPGTNGNQSGSLCLGNEQRPLGNGETPDDPGSGDTRYPPGV